MILNISSGEEKSIDTLQSKTQESYLVTFDGTDDQEDVRNMSYLNKWWIAIVISVVSICVTCLSSVWSLASSNIIKHFNVSHEIGTLGITFYIFGLGTGDNIGGMIFGRFMSGFFGASFMAVASGTFSDIFSKQEIVYPLVLYTMSPFVGPGLGPLISGLVNSYLDFRWTFYIMLIWSAVMLVMVIFFVPETYQPVLLVKKAKRLRKVNNDQRYYAPLEKTENSLISTILLSSERPFMLLFCDRMTFVLCFYTGFVLAIVYMFFVAFPYIFKSVYGFSLQAQGFSFLGLLIGMIIFATTTPFFLKKHHAKLVVANGGVDKPEFKFIPLMVGVFVVPIGLFILAWTCYSHTHWIGPIIGSAIYGGGLTLVFNGIFGYTIDAYRLYTASAMAANSFTRSIMSGVFPLFALQMYQGLGVHWASFLLACFACALIPIPFLFYKYGEHLRMKSKYTWCD